MIHEISQNVAGAPPTQSKEVVTGVPRTQGQSAVKAPNAERLAGNAEVEPIGPAQPAVTDRQAAEEVADDLNDFVQAVNRQLQFSVDKESDKTVIKVVDTESGDVIRSIPSEEILNLQKQLKESIERLFPEEQMNISLLYQGKA